MLDVLHCQECDAQLALQAVGPSAPPTQTTANAQICAACLADTPRTSIWNKRRRAAQVSLRELASRTGLPIVRLNDIDHGRSEPTASEEGRIVAVLDARAKPRKEGH